MFHPSQFVPDIEIGDQVKLGDNPIKRLIKSEPLFKPGVQHVCNPQQCALQQQPQQQQQQHSSLRQAGVKTLNPFLLPLKYGFHRVALKQDPRRRRPDDQEEAFPELQYNEHGIKLAYVTPCGKVLYCMEHIRRYLAAVLPVDGKISEEHLLPLDLDHFTFSEGFHLKRQTIGNAHTYCPDVSCGREERPVSAINQVDERSFQFDFLYVSARRFFNKSPGGVNLEDFRVSCSCEGDCGEVDACACRMLTQTDNCGMSGYSYKRLMTKHDFGIFECNAGCRCSTRCLNRVVGNGVKCQLQAFATKRKGWGVRALHFIPRGTFVCVYNGQILTDDQANLVPKDYYLAALDHIEVAVESGGGGRGGGSRANPDEVALNLSRTEMFGQARPHVVDGSRYTNVGRFFNHSCAPNMFIQNVFLETHDLRFSHLAYFTSVDVAPMEELTWDYNWQINPEDRQPVYCNCLDLRCAFRLR